MFKPFAQTIVPITLIALVSDHEYISNSVFSRDGKTLAVCYERPGNVLKTWDTATWQETATFTHVAERIDYHVVCHRRCSGALEPDIRKRWLCQACQADLHA